MAACFSGCGDRSRNVDGADGPRAGADEPVGSPTIIAQAQTPLGTLRQVDDFPLYVLELAVSYDLDDLVRNAGSAALTVETRAAFACTCYAAALRNGSRVFGRNFDWAPNPALLLISRPENGYASLAMVDISYLGYSAARTPLDDPSALVDAWRIPFDGMNEKGLAVGMMAVDRANGMSGEGRPLVGELGIMRMVLDRAADVREALALMASYDIELADPPIHYLMADRGGDAAVVEYMDGSMTVIRNTEPWLVSTNFILTDVPAASRDGVCPRYAYASRALSKGAVADGNAAMDILSAVSQPSTRWSALYDLEEATMELALGGEYGRVLEFGIAGEQ